MLKAVISPLLAFFRLLSLALPSRRALVLENLALRRQIAVYQRTTKRPRLRNADRLFWVWLSRCWSGWRDALILVQPRTVVGWHRRGFRILISYSAYYHGARPHLGLGKDAPIPRQVQGPERGKVVAFPEVGGLHHRYQRHVS